MSASGAGRSREVDEILLWKRAALVGRLLLGELNAPMQAILPSTYLAKPRHELKRERDSIRAYLRGEVARFCRSNFQTLQPEDLSRLYAPLSESGGFLNMPLVQFVRDYGPIKPKALRGAPLHATVVLSPWGMQFEFPEHHLVRDVANALNAATQIEFELARHVGTAWSLAKGKSVRPEIASLLRQGATHRRMCILSCFNLVEAYINGVAWEYVANHGTAALTDKTRNTLTEEDRVVSIIDKLVRVPKIVDGGRERDGPLHQTRDPLKAFIELVKPYRDSIVHASPFAAAERFGGYEKLSKLYELSLPTCRVAVETSLSIIRTVHQHIAANGSEPVWFLSQQPDGTFLIPVDDDS